MLRKVVSLLTVSLALALANTTLVAQTEPEEAPRGRLTLRNGDYLGGSLAPAEDPSIVAWSCDAFADPLQFKVEAVEKIEYGKRPAADPSSESMDPVRNLNPTAGLIRLIRSIPRASKTEKVAKPEGARFALIGDAVIYGKLIDWSDNQVTLESQRHGRVTLLRPWIQEIEGVNDASSLLFDGSGRLSLWKSIGEEPRSIDEWQQVGHELHTSKKGANLFYEATEPGPWHLEVTLRAEANLPEFQLALGLGSTLQDLPQSYCVDSWGPKLVAYREGNAEIELVQLENLELQKGVPVTLQLFFHPEKKELTVFSQGKQLGQLKINTATNPAAKGLMIRNRGKQLQVQRVRLRRWNGEMADLERSETRDVVSTLDGQRHEGRIERIDIEKGKLVLQVDEESKEIDWSQIDRLRMASTDSPDITPADAANQELRIDYADGADLRGRYRGASAEGLWLEIPQSPNRILCRLQGANRVQWSAATAARDPNDEFTALVEGVNHRLHGRIVHSPSAQALTWLPAGGVQSSRFAAEHGTKVTFEPSSHSHDASQAEHLLTLDTGETIPCIVRTISAESLKIQLPGGESATVPREKLKAIRFQQSSNWLYKGLHADDLWLTLGKEGIQWKDETLTFSRPALMARELPVTEPMTIEFDLKMHSEAFLNVVLGLGADVAENGLRRPQDFVANEDALRAAAKERPDYVAEVILTRNRRSLVARGYSRAAGVMGLMFQGNPFQNAESPTALPLNETNSAHIVLQIDPTKREFAVHGNGQLLHRWRDTSALEGNYFYLGVTNESDSILHGQPSSSGKPLASIYNLRIKRWAGELPVDNLERMLTRRVGASPKAITHVLRAMNGDSLRGQLLSMDEDVVEFQSRLDRLRIPRSKVAEIISIGPPPSANETPAEPIEKEPQALTSQSHDIARVVLRSAESVLMRQLTTNDQLLAGQSSVGPLSIYWSEIAEIHFGSDRVPEPPYSTWVQRDPPPLPEMPESAGQQSPSPLLDKPAPDVRLSLLDGRKMALSDLKGRIVILDFWATWCGPCLSSLPTMIEIAEQNQADVTLIAVNQQESEEELKEFMAAQLWDFPVGLDLDGQLGQIFGASAIPFTVIIDSTGVVRHVHVGATADLKQELTEKIEQLRAAQP